MVPPDLDQHQLRFLIKTGGFGSQQAFAKAVGLSGPKLSNILNGSRRAQTAEVQRMAMALKVPPSKILQALGTQYSSPIEAIYKIEGAVSDEEEVVMYSEYADDYGLYEVQLGYIFYGGSILSIKTDVLAPRYLRDEMIGVNIYGDRRFKTADAIGIDVVAKVEGGPLLLKSLHPGSKPDHFTLLSPNARLPPMLDARLEWAEPVAFRLPKRP